MASKYTDELKAQVIADYAMGASKAALAKKYGLGRSTVIAWVHGHEPPIPTVSDRAQRDELGQIVYEYLVTGFGALIAQHRLASDPAYLQLPETSELSVYNTILAGVVSVAQAIERGQREQSDADTEADNPSAIIPG